MPEKLLSVIIPVYNTEPLLDRCLNSLRSQTYKNIEIVVVDDCSPGPVKEIMKRPENSDIKFTFHEKNMGLFKARLTGSKIATGDYICFLDSDDYVSRDFYRSLMKKAVDGDFDIVAGRTIFEKVDGKCFIRNLHEMSFGHKDLYGVEPRKNYFRQSGSCFAWHTIWNKIYKKSLWDDCLPYYQKMPLNTIMTEDIAFSSLLFYSAESFSYVQNEGIHYCENISSSTYSDRISFEKFNKNVKDMKNVFDFVDSYLTEKNADVEIKQNFINFRKKYSRLWRNLQIDRFQDGKEKEDAAKVIDSFLPEYCVKSAYEEYYFELFETEYDRSMENIKEIIVKDKIKAVSFDIFDTIIKRPFYKPDDIFHLMEETFRKTDGRVSSFSYIRKKSEEDLRSRWWKLNPGSEDFTLRAIYDHMINLFGVSKQTANCMYEMEKNLEIRFCEQRRAIKDLYDLAVYMGKRIILISDTYLEEETVNSILSKNGYSSYEKLFLSSKEGRTKYSGKLFELALQYLNLPANSVAHLGDNWKNDFLKSRSYGMIPILIPKTLESMEGKIQNTVTNNLGSLTTGAIGKILSDSQLKKSFNYRTFIALVANEEFDHPYVSYNPESDFNGSPWLFGRYAVGMHVIGICRWLISEAKSVEAPKIILLSRDGYVINEALKIISNYSEGPDTEYVYCSRSAVMPWMISAPEDLLDLPLEITAHSPRSVSSLVNFCTNMSLDEIKEKTKCDENWESKFTSFGEYSDFILKFIKTCYSSSKHNTSKENVSKYYRNTIPPGSLVFDMGYSGRIPAAISAALGYDVRFAYVYSETDSCNRYLCLSDTKMSVMYPVSPSLSGFFREYFLSELNGQCLGFKKNRGKISPIISESSENYLESFAVEQLQEGALSMVDEYYRLFSDWLDVMDSNPFRESLPFESALRNSTDFDMRIFLTSFSDDVIHGGRERINVYNLWKSMNPPRAITPAPCIPVTEPKESEQKKYSIPETRSNVLRRLDKWIQQLRENIIRVFWYKL